jgi:hypothetical protein
LWFGGSGERMSGFRMTLRLDLGRARPATDYDGEGRETEVEFYWTH